MIDSKTRGRVHTNARKGRVHEIYGTLERGPMYVVCVDNDYCRFILLLRALSRLTYPNGPTCPHRCPAVDDGARRPYTPTDRAARS